MTELWTRLTTVEHRDPHTQRRGRLLATVLLMIIVLDLFCIPVALFGTAPVSGVVVIGLSLAIFSGILALVRRGYVAGAGWSFVLTMIVAIASSVPFGSPVDSLFFLALAVIVASLVLRPPHIWLVLPVALGVAVTVFLLRPGAASDPESLNSFVLSALLLVAVTFLAFLGARAMEQALQAAEVNAQEASEARARAEVQAGDLAAQAEALRHTERQLHNLVGTLETPTVSVAEGVLLAPLIGAIDSRRAQNLTGRLLKEIAAQRAGLLIIDVAGVTLIDTAVAQMLIKIAQAVRLLGCRVVLTGVAPTVALTLTQLGTGLEGIETARSPQDVLAADAGAGVAPALVR